MMEKMCLVGQRNAKMFGYRISENNFNLLSLASTILSQGGSQMGWIYGFNDPFIGIVLYT